MQYRSKITINRQTQIASFSLTELLVSISILAILASILNPSLRNAVASGRNITCKNNQKAMYGFSSLYMEDHDDHFPKAGYEWNGQIEAYNTTDVDNFFGTTWDDLLSMYDGRDLSKGQMKVNSFIIKDPKPWNKSFLAEKHMAMEFYMCPEDDFERRNYGSGERIGKSYSMNAHSPFSDTFNHSRADYNIDTYARKGISVGAHSVTNSEVEAPNETIFLAESHHKNNDLGGAAPYITTPKSTYDMYPGVVDLESKGRYGAHSSYLTFNFLITDGHVEELLLNETHIVGRENNGSMADGMWSRQAGD